MTQNKITNFHEQKPLSGGEPKELVILLHGLGSNGNDLISLAPLWAQEIPNAVFVSPDAPFMCDMVPPGYPNAYQWFSLQNRDPDTVLQGVQRAAPILESFITEQLDKYGLLASRLALVGFSQGTMMSLYSGPRYHSPIAGVLGYSGALVWESDVDQAILNRVPVHLIHGEMDDVVPISAYVAACEQLKACGFSVTGHTTPSLTHSIDQHGVNSGGKFLASVFS